MAKKKKTTTPKAVDTLTHDDATRKNIPAAEMQSIVDEQTKRPVQVAYERRNRDLDPQLIWRGKYPKNPDTGEEDMDLEDDLLVSAPPLYIQEKVHPKVLIDDLMKQTKAREEAANEPDQLDLFGDFNGVPEGDAKTEFYQHDAHWTNRMILGDSLQVMASLAEREELRGKVQCIFFDPPYGIKFNSNFQWSTKSSSVKDGKVDHITREPEQVKAFRDTWKDGIHSYLGYIRDRLVAARDLLNPSGSIFLQIGDENVHRLRLVLDEVFGDQNFVRQIPFSKSSTGSGDFLPAIADTLLWYTKDINYLKVNSLLQEKTIGGVGGTAFTSATGPKGEKRPLSLEEKINPKLLPKGWKVSGTGDLTSSRPPGDFPVDFQGKIYRPKRRFWSTGETGMPRLIKSDRIYATKNNLAFKRYFDDFTVFPLTNVWTDTVGQSQYGGSKTYVVQTGLKVVQRCILMTTDPGDLVLDPTCGSGTTALVSEQWGRRWITIDTSRVALALARARIMGAKYPFYILADTQEGVELEAKITRSLPVAKPYSGSIRQGFVYHRVPHITLRDISNNAEIDEIHDQFQLKLEPLREQINKLLGTSWEEWEIPRSLQPSTTPARMRPDEERISGSAPSPSIPKGEEARADKLLAGWWKLRIARQKEIDASIAAKADTEYLYDKPYEDKSKVRVAGPFTVESISPHRMYGIDENDEFFDPLEREDPDTYGQERNFEEYILNNLRTAGVQQTDKEDKIKFDSLIAWPGKMISGEGIYEDGEGNRRRAAIHIGPEFGSVSRPDLVDSAREAADAGFDILVACGFNFDAHSTEFSQLGRLPVLKARMNADLHMPDLAESSTGNLFIVFGEPIVELATTEDDQLTVQVLGVDIYVPKTGEVRENDVKNIACWFIDTNYNGESFFVRHAYFLGANDPYKSLKTTLKAEVDREAWETLNKDISRPFPKPETGRIAIKIINHLGDEVMKIMRVE